MEQMMWCSSATIWLCSIDQYQAC